MKNAAKVIGLSIIVAALVTAGAHIEISVWDECRASHSWLYCARTLTK